jgi:hypothetical protein
MAANSGIIVQYTNKDGITQKGIIRHADQIHTLQMDDKLLVRVVDDNYNPKLNDAGKEVIVFKRTDQIKQIGFTD